MKMMIIIVVIRLMDVVMEVVMVMMMIQAMVSRTTSSGQRRIKQVLGWPPSSPETIDIMSVLTTYDEEGDDCVRGDKADGGGGGGGDGDDEGDGEQDKQPGQ